MGDASYRRVAEDVAARIRAGELRPQARLPLDDLEAAHGQAVTAAAVAWLVAHRWVVRAPGLGVRVAATPPELDAAVPPPDELLAQVQRLTARVEELERWRAEHEARSAGRAGGS